MKTENDVKDLTQKTQVQLIDEIIIAMEEKKLSEESIQAAMPSIKAFAEKNELSIDAAMLAIKSKSFTRSFSL